jgi:hypothetical protein
MKKFLFISLLLVAFFNCAFAQTPGVVLSENAGWHKIAERHADYKSDRDEVIVVGNNHFRQIKLRVKDAPVNVASMDLYFGNGSKRSVEVNKVLQVGDETMPADIDNTLALQKIILVYNTVGAGTKDVTMEKRTTGSETETEKEHERETEKERAEVEIWGLK